MRDFSSVKKIVIKVGTSTLTFKNGSLNLAKIEALARVISDLKNSGKDVILVSSGAIGVGISRVGLSERPRSVPGKQAMAAIGQCQLMSIYDEFFRRYNHIVGQILLTKDVVTNEKMNQNAVNTFNTLLDHGVIPIVNENDTVSIDEIEFGDNDTLSAYVTNIIHADLLILLTDVDGFYDKDPSQEGAKLISEVNAITDTVKENAGGAGSKQGTGGMETKIMAVSIAANSGAKTVIMNGENPMQIYELLRGEEIGTYFNC